MKSWGRGESGVLGTCSVNDELSPKIVRFGCDLGLIRVKQLSCGWFHNVRSLRAAAAPTFANHQ